MADFCFCNICTLPDALGNPRCNPKLKRILVTVIDQPDPTNSPNLWRTSWQGSTIIPVKFFQGTPTVGDTYIGHLMCSSGEYVSFLPSAEGTLWVLYNDQEVYVVSLPSTATLKDNWGLTVGATGNFIALGVEQGEKLNILADSTEIYYSANTADSWSNVQSLTQSGSDVRYDHTTEGLGFLVERPNSTLSTAEEATLAGAIGTLSTGNYTPTTVHNNYVDWFADIQPIKIWTTSDNGATWSSSVLEYAGNLFPSRIIGSEFATQFQESVFNGNCGWDAHLDICGWETLGDVPGPGTYPCMLGALTFINQSGSPRDITNRRDTSGVVVQYGVCDSTGATDPDNLLFFPASSFTSLIAPKHNGVGYYVAVAGNKRAETFTGLFSSTDYASPFVFHPSPTLAISRTTFIVNDAGSSWEIEPGDLTNGGSERITVDIQVDKTNVDRIFAISSFSEVYRLRFASQSITEITPVPNGDIYTLSESWVTPDGTLLLPIAYDDSGDDVFGVFRSTDQGGSWVFTDLTSASTDIFSETCRIAQSSDGTLFMALKGGKFAYSTNDGVTWLTTDDLTGNTEDVIDVAAS